MATGGQGRPVAVLASGLYQAELRERMAVPPSKALKRTWQDTGWGWEPCPGWDAQEAALPGDRVRNGELPGQAVRALGRVPQPDRKPAGEGGLHPSGVGAVSTCTPSPSSQP